MANDKKTRAAIMEEPAEKANKQTYLTTGCTMLNLVVGGGMGLGIPTGIMVNLVGDKSSGKTFVANEIVAANHHRLNRGKKPNFVWHFDDSESGHTFDTKKLYGVDIRPEGRDLEDSTTVEEMDTNVGLFLRKVTDDQIGLYVVDSLDGLSDDEKEERAEARVTAAEKGKDLEQNATYGVAAPKYLSQEFFRTKVRQLRDRNVTLVIVSQVRENMDRLAFGKKYKRSGGKALDFYAHTCLWLANICKIEKNGRAVGVVVEAKAEKSKTGRPFRSCRFSLYFDYGIDNIGTNLDYLFDLRDKDGKLLKAAESVCWDGKEPKNLETLRAWLEREKLLDDARAAKKAQTGKANLSVDWILDWCAENPERLAALDAHFGTSLPREELIRKIEIDPAMVAELEQRVIAKWEAFEAEIATGRPGKYAEA